MDASAILVPHPDKSATGGEDSCFVLKRSNAFGVFDGVGGWSDEGVNPAEYPETFASEAAKAVTKDKMRNPVDIMVRAHKMTRVVGSSTACVCVVEEGEATFANVGDAGGIVARNGACVFKTEPMQHEFNMPFQLGWKEAYPETDDPRRADVKKVRLKRGDCVVLGSDGLWDNVPHEDVAILCDENEGDAVKCAEQIARLAFSRSTDEELFDGVGGWSDEGVNPAEYPETFASEAAKAVTKDKMRNPVDIMVRAHKMTRVVGSSTACVCVVEEGEATFANVGDAGGIVARNGACVFKTEPMQHEFNMPFQLGWKEAYPETDDPRRADVKKVRLKRGDCVVLGSDGLWDNVPHEDVAILCDENEGDAVKCAEQIARLAFSRSTDEEYDSPFMIAARREGMELTWAEKLQGVKLTGGKMDDIAVVVAFVG